MKSMVMAVTMGILLSYSTAGFCETNGLAMGVEKVTKTPFSMLKGANDHLFSPVKDVDHAALDFTDNARAAVVSVGLNLGAPVE